MKKLYIGSDHAGMGLKNHVKDFVIKCFTNIEVIDVGTYEKISCHYPDFA